MAKWISVNDHLPKANVRCFIYWPYGGVGIYIAEFNAETCGFYNEDDGTVWDGVTHWRRMIRKPKEDEQ